jgi:Sec-independent protein translocase protein TatA
VIIVAEVVCKCSVFASDSIPWRSGNRLGIVEIAVLLIVALIVIPPENLPEVARAAGKVLRELRLASNTVMRELSTIDEPTRVTSPPPEPADPQASKSAEPADPT